MAHIAKREILNEIMATDITVLLCDPEKPPIEMESDLDKCIDMFRAFESNFSRFKTDNELFYFNESSGDISVSNEMYEMLSISEKYTKLTQGFFDITTLPFLLSEGYVLSKNKGYIPSKAPVSDENIKNVQVATYKLLPNLKVRKSKELKVDLGGIGKGYIVNKVSQFLRTKYKNYIVDAGGDMYLSGNDLVNNYDYWAVGIEDPTNYENELSILLVSNKSVATSGVNRRVWKKDGYAKNHLIDPITKKSVENELVSVTVVSDSVIEADIMAKSLLLMGLSAGLTFSAAYSISSFFIDKKLNCYKSPEMENYVWKN
jgi:thiamine biosynthesis lipoprotein